MSHKFTAVLTTINAPHKVQIDEGVLVQCLLAERIEDKYVGHLWSFFGEVPVDEQISFAAHHSISVAQLRKSVARFSVRSGMIFPMNRIQG